MNAEIKIENDQKKFTISREMFLVGILSIIAVVTFYKMKPYFEEKIEVVAISPELEIEPPSISAPRVLSLGDEPKTKPIAVTKKVVKPNRPRVLERPLFDGGFVQVKAVTLRELTSIDNEKPIEVKITGVVDDALQTEFSRIEGAKLFGRHSADFENERITMEFTELATPNGKAYRVIGYATNAEGSVEGIQAKRESGRALRAIGTGISRAIGVGDEILRNRYLDGQTSENVIIRQAEREAFDASYGVAQDIGDAATKDLREAKEKLKLPAGTSFIVQLQIGTELNGKRL